MSGLATKDRPEIKRAVEAIKRVFDFSVVGGRLHIVIDDLNTGDRSLEFCRKLIEAAPHDPEVGAERECYEALVALSEDDRDEALRIFERRK